MFIKNVKNFILNSLSCSFAATFAAKHKYGILLLFFDEKVF